MTTDTIPHDKSVPLKITNKILQLSKENLNERKQILAELSDLIIGVGITEDDLEQTFQLICNETETKISGSEKRFLLQHIMIFNQQNDLDPDLIYKIISHVGIPQVYFKNGRKTKLRKLSKTLQLQLLEWLICNFHLFGEKGYQTLRRMLPILFKNLSFEFLRPQIARIIFLTVLQGSSTFKTLFNKKKNHIIDTIKPWHVQLVLDLFHKFPMDEYLKALLILFEATMDLNFNLRSIKPQIFAYPNIEFLKLLELVKSNQVQEESLRENLRKYESFSTTLTKRRKYRSNIDFEEYAQDFSTTTSLINISSIRSTKALVSNLNNITNLNFDRLFDSLERTPTERYTIFYLTLKGIEEKDQNQILKKLDYYIRLSILDDNLSAPQLNILCDKLELLLLVSAGQVYHPLIIDFVLYKYNAKPIAVVPQKTEILVENLKQRLKFLKFLPILEFSEFKKSFLLPTFDVFTQLLTLPTREYYFACFVHHLLLLFSIWIVSEKQQTTTQKFQKFNLIDRSLPLIYEFIKTIGSKSSYMQLLVLEILRFITSSDNNSLNLHFNDEAVILPPDIIYTMVLEGNPFVSSEVYGYIARCKNYQFKSDKFKGIQNSYIMDMVNLLWRDRALTYEESLTSSNKALFLDPGFLARLGNLQIFTYSNLVTFDTIGNLFVNPAWSFITSQLIRKFEDLAEDINTRHEGPVSASSIIRINSDPEIQWLNLGYDDLKLKMLYELDDLGFKGLGDLLFNSLKTLKDKRRENYERSE